MRCTKCGSDNPEGKKFCGDCASPLTAAGSGLSADGAPSTSDVAWLRRVYELGNAFAERLELDDLIPFVLAGCREVLSAEGVAVLFIDSQNNELYFPYVSEDDPEVAARLRGLRFPADRGIAGAVLRTGRAEKVDDVRSDPRFFSDVDRQTGRRGDSRITRSPIMSPAAPTADQPGLFRAAAGGVIFLDEIGEMPFPMQAKLLRVLQDSEVSPRRLFVKTFTTVSPRFRSTCRRCVRREDIALLAVSFLEGAAQRHHKRLRGFDPATIEMLGLAMWPGNVRELQNEVERAVALPQADETIMPRHLSPNLRSAAA